MKIALAILLVSFQYLFTPLPPRLGNFTAHYCASHFLRATTPKFSAVSLQVYVQRETVNIPYSARLLFFLSFALHLCPCTSCKYAYATKARASLICNGDRQLSCRLPLYTRQSSLLLFTSTIKPLLYTLAITDTDALILPPEDSGSFSLRRHNPTQGQRTTPLSP